MKLTQSVSLFTLLSSAIAGIVGSGWLLGPMACAKIAGPAASVSWMLGGVLMMIVAATFVILTRVMPIAGGTVRFFQMNYGHFAGYSFAWIAWLAWVAVSPIETMALIQYSANYFSGLMTSGVSPVLTPWGMCIAMSCMVIITTINGCGIKIYGRLNSVILAFKLMIPAITVCLLLGRHFDVSNFTSAGGFMPYGMQSVFSALPLAGVIYSFIGFNPAIQLASESTNPKRDIPIAVFGALIVCIVLYTMIQIAFIGAVPHSAIAHGWASLRFAGDMSPFVGLLSALGVAWFVKALYLDSAISPFGTAMVQAMATGRITYAMSKNGYFPQRLEQVNANGSPKRAMMVNMLVGFAFFLPFPSWQHMVGFLVSCLVIGYVVGPMSLMMVCQKESRVIGKQAHVWIHMVCLTAFVICNLMIMWSGWDVVYKITILFACGYVVLGLNMLNKKQALRIGQLDIMRGSWVVIYMMGLAIITRLSSFGPGHVIGFGYDFVVIALFSALIYALAGALACGFKSIRTRNLPLLQT